MKWPVPHGRDVPHLLVAQPRVLFAAIGRPVGIRPHLCNSYPGRPQSQAWPCPPLFSGATGPAVTPGHDASHPTRERRHDQLIPWQPARKAAGQGGARPARAATRARREPGRELSRHGATCLDVKRFACAIVCDGHQGSLARLNFRPMCNESSPGRVCLSRSPSRFDEDSAQRAISSLKFQVPNNLACVAIVDNGQQITESRHGLPPGVLPARIHQSRAGCAW